MARTTVYKEKCDICDKLIDEELLIRKTLTKTCEKCYKKFMNKRG